MNFLSNLLGAAETAPNAGTGEVTEAVLPQDVVATVQPYHRKKIRYTLDEKRAICQKIWNREMKQAEAARAYGVSDRVIRKWKTTKPWEREHVNPHSLTAHAGAPVIYSDMEEEVFQWLVQQRQQGLVVTTRTIVYAALRIEPTLFGCDDGLIESRQLEWAYRFMRRRRLVVRKGTHVGQKLVSQLLDEVVDFVDMITRMIAEGPLRGSLVPKRFWNMDETIVYFESRTTSSVELKGTQTVNIRCNGSNHQKVTVGLTVASDGTKFPPLVIARGKVGAKRTNKVERELAQLQEELGLQSMPTNQ